MKKNPLSLVLCRSESEELLGITQSHCIWEVADTLSHGPGPFYGTEGEGILVTVLRQST